MIIITVKAILWLQQNYWIHAKKKYNTLTSLYHYLLSRVHHAPGCVPLSITICYPVCITRTWLCTSFHHYLLSCVHHTHLAVYLFSSLFVIPCASHTPGCVPLSITICYPVCITRTWLCTPMICQLPGLCSTAVPLCSAAPAVFRSL